MDTQNGIWRLEGVIEQVETGLRRVVARTAGGQAAGEVVGSTWGRMGELLGPVTWDWQGWLPQGFLVILASEPGLGKSLLCLRLAGCYLAGMDWPDGRPFEGERGKVLWCESEAGQALNLNRARAWGLDLEQIVTPLNNPLQNFKMDNPQHAVALLAQARRPEVRLVVLDSLRGLHSRGGNIIVESVANLADMARVIGKPVLLTHHLRKRSLLDVAGELSLDRLRGSGAITQPARVVWTLDKPDMRSGTNRRLSVLKSNLAAFPEPIGMWVNEGVVRFGAAPERPVGERELERGVGVLRALLADGERPFEEVVVVCRAAGMTEGTMRRAKKVLGVRSIRVPGTTGWYWAL
jgi:hypothetical protein